MEKVRFIARGHGYKTGIVVEKPDGATAIQRIEFDNITGYTTDDAAIIKHLRKSAGYGRFFNEVPTEQQLVADVYQKAKELVKVNEAIAVEPVAEVDIIEEELVLEAEKQAQAEADNPPVVKSKPGRPKKK